jgi:ferritin-like metal-binding protein YciE
MSRAEQKIVQYLEEAQATERTLIRVLQSQIAMTPRGSYRTALETHLRETRQHADRVGRRLQQLGHGGNPLMAVLGLAESVAGQALALTKTPLDLLRGTGGAEKVLKNAKDTSATEALEIATYTAIERLARDVGDDETAQLAASIRADEERMLARVVREIPKLTDAVLGGSYDVSTTGAADAERKTAGTAKRTARQARKVPGATRAEGQIKGAVASADDLAIARYDALTAEEIIGRLAELSQIDLGKIDSYERRNQNRATVLNRIGTLRADEPWPGYDELTAAEVQAVLGEGDNARAREALGYERAHKNRAGVIRAAERQPSTA